MRVAVRFKKSTKPGRSPDASGANDNYSAPVRSGNPAGKHAVLVSHAGHNSVAPRIQVTPRIRVVAPRKPAPRNRHSASRNIFRSYQVMPAQHFIANRWVEPASGQTLPMIDPSDGREFARIARGNAADIDRAVKAAEGARDGAWGKLPPVERGRLLA